MFRHVAFGLRWDSDVALEHFADSSDAGAPDIVVRRAAGPLPRRTELRAMDNASLCTDGARLHVGDEIVIDIFASGRIDYLPGPAWTGRFPVLFYGTLVALLLAWRGGVPIHGSSVEIEGQAWLICGNSGAGKSTLTAALIASGSARLISDDLTTLEPGSGDGAPVLYPGRPAIRLFPALADLMRGIAVVRKDPGNDKLLVLPPGAEPLIPIALAGTIILGADAESIPLWRRSAFLDTQVYRPRWMWEIPDWHSRFRVIHCVATSLPMLSLDAADIRDAEAFRLRAEDALFRIKSA